MTDFGKEKKCCREAIAAREGGSENVRETALQTTRTVNNEREEVLQVQISLQPERSKTNVSLQTDGVNLLVDRAQGLLAREVMGETMSVRKRY